jgi:hypothetical protein
MSKRYPLTNKWTVSSARQNLPRLLDAVLREPQAIYRRKRLVATVIEPSAASKLKERPDDDKGGTVGSAFAALRAICADERYEFPIVSRTNRSNPFAGKTK